MSYPLDLVALSASCLALYFIIRAKRTYFLDSGLFMGIANVGFIVYLANATFADINNTYVWIQLDAILISVMATSIGFASYLLRSGDQRDLGGLSELKGFFSKLPFPFMIYLGMVVAWTFSSLVFSPWTLNSTTDSPPVYYYTSPGWFIAESVALLSLFVGLPVLSFYRQSNKIDQKTASLSIRIISICWAFFGLSVFIQVIGGAFLLPNAQSAGFVLDSLLFVLIAFALREPTVLARIVTAGETVSLAINSRSESDTIILYNTESDRRSLVETFVRDGLANEQEIVCLVTKGEAPFYRAVLKGPSLSGLSETKRSAIVQSIDAPANEVSEPSSHGSNLKGRRELVDLDELDIDHCREVIRNLDTSDYSNQARRAGRIWALNVEGANAGVLDVLTSRDPKSRVIDLAEQQDVFSAQLGFKHQDILGSRLLLEYDPTSNYEDVVQEFVREFQANVDSVAIFTSGGSPIYRQFSDQRNIRLFSFSTKTSTPARLSDEQVLLPERDTSLLLDAVDKLLQAHSGRRIGIVFEVFTYLILSLGFEKAYGVISSIVEMSESELATILVLVNSDALEQRVLNGMRGLFQSQMRFDSQGLKATRVEKSDYSKIGATGESVSDLSESSRRLEA